jgi:hypothetical protein
MGANPDVIRQFTGTNFELGGSVPAHTELITTWAHVGVRELPVVNRSVQSVRPTRTPRRSDRNDRPSGVNTEEMRTSTVIVGLNRGCATAEPQRLQHHLAYEQFHAGSLPQPISGVFAPRPKGLS